MLEIPALLSERSKHSGKLRLCESLRNRHKQQVRWSSSMDRAPRCLRSCLCASARVLLQGSPSSWGNENKSSLCISSVVLWLFLRPACVGSHADSFKWTPQATDTTSPGHVSPKKGKVFKQPSELQGKHRLQLPPAVISLSVPVLNKYSKPIHLFQQWTITDLLHEVH